MTALISSRERVEKPGRTMRTLLRQFSTGLYFQRLEEWTNDPAAALDFTSIDSALDFLRNHQLTNVELAFAFDRSRSIRTTSLDKLALRSSVEELIIFLHP